MNKNIYLSECNDILSPKDVQNILQVSKTTVYRLLDKGCIEYFKIGRIYRIPKCNLEKYIRTCASEIEASK